MNKVLLNDKYKNLIPPDIEKFIEDVNDIKNKINFNNLLDLPILIYSKNKRNALYYTLCMLFSLRKEAVLSYAVITGQTLINQHFLSEENRDIKLSDSIYYSDITFISLSQYDYSSEYLEALIIDLVEFRRNNSKITIISYDILDATKTNYISFTQKLHSYFITNDFQVLDLSNTISPGYVKKQIKKSKGSKRIE